MLCSKIPISSKKKLRWDDDWAYINEIKEYISMIDVVTSEGEALKKLNKFADHSGIWSDIDTTVCRTHHELI